MVSPDQFPRLHSNNHRVTSPADPTYNCIAWAAADTEHWWQPGVHWPVQVSTDAYGIAALEDAFRGLGYQRCQSSALEPGVEKVALYGDGTFYTHAARQLAEGRWTSKLGHEEDIEHDAPEDLAAGIYGAVVLFMSRPAAVVAAVTS